MSRPASLTATAAALCVLWLAAFALLPDPAQAQYCGRRLIHVGDTRYNVLSKCGDPVLREERTIFRELPNPFGLKDIAPIRIEEWTYNPGPTRFVFTIVFVNGRVDSVQRHGEYGW